MSGLDEVRERMAAALREAGRSSDAVRLIAVSKRQPLEKIVTAYEAGVRDFGESTAQELHAKADAMAAAGRDVRWHFIGHLQRNKAKVVLQHAAMIHTVDRLELAETLSRRAPPGGVDVLVQVNIGREPQKGGVDPDAALELAQQVAGLPGLSLRGLMAIPPAETEPALYFDELGALLAQLRQLPAGRDAVELSMGMSHDFETAIRHGATLVRVGTAIFGDRRRDV